MSLKLFACGDIVNSAAKRDFVDNQLKEIITNSDISIGNFEAPIETEHMKAIKKVGPHVYQSKKSVQYLSEVGFDMVSLANNHIYDYGQDALEKTLDELKKHDLRFIGAGVDFDSAYKAQIIEKEGINIGVLAGCENEFGCLYENQERGGYAWLFHHLIEDNIVKLKQEVDSIVLIAHAGAENIPIPIKEWRARYKRLCDIGVDIIIGHHPHVPQGYEKYNGSIIFYSLGNFYFDTCSFKEKTDDSYSVLLDFDKDTKIAFKIIYHKKINGQTCFVKEEEVDFSLNKLNSLLEYDYEERNNSICIELFYKYYYGYYENALGVLPKKYNIMQSLKFLLKKILFNNKSIKNRNLMLLHNIRIDSHRFVVQRALSLLSERDYK